MNFDFAEMPKDKLFNLSFTLLKNEGKDEELKAFDTYLKSVFEKEQNTPENLTVEEIFLLSLQQDVYLEFIEWKEKKQANEEYVKGMLQSERNLAILLNNVSLEDIMKEKPSITELPEGISCMALKIEADNSWNWVFGSGNIAGSMFALHESVDGSVEKHYRSIKEAHNKMYPVCDCSCHFPQTSMRHIAPCCNNTYQKVFTSLLEE